jgi:transposase InsO family protein
MSEASRPYRWVVSIERWPSSSCYDNAVMESFFSTVKSELGDRFDSCGVAKMELFD